MTVLRQSSHEIKLGRANKMGRFFDAAIAAEGLSESEVRNGIADLLTGVSEPITPDSIEAALGLMCHLGDAEPYVEELCGLLLMDGHEKHEDVAHNLQLLRDPRAIEPLYEAAQKTLDYQWDDGLAFARKCTWALADIGGEVARDRLRKLAVCSNPDIAGFAQRRLDRWDEVLDRKRL